MSAPLTLVGGMALAPDGNMERADIHIANGMIVETKPSKAAEIDCRDLHILPGIIDVHGDAFETELFPRPGVDIPIDIAMRSVDCQLLSNGITTAFHGVSASWEPGVRSLDAARRFMAELSALRSQLAADHRVQIRWETFAHDALPDLQRWLTYDPKPAIAFNDHTTDTLEAVATGNVRKLDRWAQRAGLTSADYVAAAQAVHANAPDVSAKIADVAALADAAGAIMLAHDERTITDRVANRQLGMAVSEFPLTKAVGADAVAHGEHVVMGAPNVLRGLSHKGDMSAEDAIRSGICTILASDYYYPSQIHAAERLVRRGICSVSDAWSLLSANPAEAMGLIDRGTLKTGTRADLVVLQCLPNWRTIHTIANGNLTSLAA